MLANDKPTVQPPEPSLGTKRMDAGKTDKTDSLMYIVGIVILAAFCVCVYASIFMTVISDHFVRISTMVETLVIGLAGYYFGSSKGSRDKTREMIKGKEKTE
jgi:hypothetical protein